MTGIEWDEAAVDEAEEAAEFYDSRRTHGGSEFTGRLWDAITVFREHPEAGAVVDPPVRHFPLDVFPYDLVHVPDAETIYILAVAHHRREPGYWSGRRQAPGL